MARTIPTRLSPICTIATSRNSPSDATRRPAGHLRRGASFARVYTDFLPAAEVERVEPNEQIPDVEFDMEALADAGGGWCRAVADALRDLPLHYEAWIAAQDSRRVRHSGRVAAGHRAGA